VAFLEGLPGRVDLAKKSYRTWPKEVDLTVKPTPPIPTPFIVIEQPKDY